MNIENCLFEVSKDYMGIELISENVSFDRLNSLSTWIIDSGGFVKLRVMDENVWYSCSGYYLGGLYFTQSVPLNKSYPTSFMV